MAIDSKKLKAVLTHHDQFRRRFEKDVGTYQTWRKNTEVENKVLGIFHETAYGPMKKLRDEIGLKDRFESLPWTKVRDITEGKEGIKPGNPDTDHTHTYMMNALFAPIDMTDYEESFLGEYHSNKFMPAYGAINYNREDAVDNHPFTADDAWIGESEKPHLGLSLNQDDKREQDPEEVEDEYPEEFEEQDEENESTWTNGEDNEEDYEEADWPPPQKGGNIPPLSDFFDSDTLHERYNEKEIDAFLKLLNVKPYSMWQDQSVYHHSMGVHGYEDEGQQLDPEYHMLAEVERKHVERWQTKDHRKGATVRFEIGETKSENARI